MAGRCPDPVRSQYHEFFVLVDARLNDEPVAWCPYIYVDNDHALARGWIQGFPKKMGAVHQTRTFASPGRASPTLAPGARFGASMSSGERTLAEDQHVTDMWAGTGDISLYPAVGEELADLAPVRMGMGFRLSMSYSVTEVRDAN